MRKRNEGTFGAWFWSVAMVMWIGVGIGIIAIGEFGILGCLIWLILSVFIGLICSFIVFTSQHVKTVEFIIYEFEIWSKDIMDYEERYVVIDNTLRAKFVFHWHVGDYESCMNQKEVEDYIMGLGDNMFFNGYKTEEEAMQHIMTVVRDFITNKKERENIRIRNIKMVGVHTVDEIVTKLENK